MVYDLSYHTIDMDVFKPNDWIFFLWKRHGVHPQQRPGTTHKVRRPKIVC
jgi:hypothetical protein